jgi:Signal transduction histidine kinase
LTLRPGPTAAFIERLPIIPNRPRLAFALTGVICIFALGLRWVLDDAFPPGYPYLTFFPAVIISSFLFGPRPGVLAALLCGLFAWYFFIPPRHTFALGDGTITALLFYIGVVTVDIALVHLMQAANRHLALAREQLRELADRHGELAARSDILFQELQHRVGNNLQMVGAVLSLQMRGLKEETARRAISDAAQRLQVIGNIQRRLYSPDGERVPLDRYIGAVTEQIRASNGWDGITWNVAIEDGIILKPDRAVPVALILSEAIANSLEHGLRGRETGRIDITAARGPGCVTLKVSDDGAGLPDTFQAEAANSIGLRISRVLAEQIKAEYGLSAGETGAVMRLSIPED